jgi:hypothetical protein
LYTVRESPAKLAERQNPFILALSNEVGRLKAALKEEEHKWASLCGLLANADYKLSEKDRLIGNLGQENEQLNHHIVCLEEQLAQLRSGLSDAFRALRRDSFAVPAIAAADPKLTDAAVAHERKMLGSETASTSHSSGSDSEEGGDNSELVKKPSVRMVVSALEGRLSEIYSAKNLVVTTPRSARDLSPRPFPARRPSVVSSTGGGSSVKDEPKARGHPSALRLSAPASPAQSDGGRRGAETPSLSSEGGVLQGVEDMKEIYFEEEEEESNTEALDSFRQEEAGPLFVASPLIQRAEGGGMENGNSGRWSSPLRHLPPSPPKPVICDLPGDCAPVDEDLSAGSDSDTMVATFSLGSLAFPPTHLSD